MYRVYQARHSQEGIVAEFHRIAETIVNAAQNYVHRLQAFHCFQVDPPVANGQIRSLSQRKSEIPCQVGVLEVGLVIGSGCQQNRAWMIAMRQAEQHLTPGAEEGSQTPDV